MYFPSATAVEPWSFCFSAVEPWSSWPPSKESILVFPTMQYNQPNKRILKVMATTVEQTKVDHVRLQHGCCLQTLQTTDLNRNTDWFTYPGVWTIYILIFFSWLVVLSVFGCSSGMAWTVVHLSHFLRIRLVTSLNCLRTRILLCLDRLVRYLEYLYGLNKISI